MAKQESHIQHPFTPLQAPQIVGKLWKLTIWHLWSEEFTYCSISHSQRFTGLQDKGWIKKKSINRPIGLPHWVVAVPFRCLSVVPCGGAFVAFQVSSKDQASFFLYSSPPLALLLSLQLAYNSLTDSWFINEVIQRSLCYKALTTRVLEFAFWLSFFFNLRIFSLAVIHKKALPFLGFYWKS